MINPWTLITFMAVLFTVAACSVIEISGENHTVNTSAEMHTGSSNEAKSEVSSDP